MYVLPVSGIPGSGRRTEPKLNIDSSSQPDYTQRDCQRTRRHDRKRALLEICAGGPTRRRGRRRRRGDTGRRRLGTTSFHSAAPRPSDVPVGCAAAKSRRHSCRRCLRLADREAATTAATSFTPDAVCRPSASGVARLGDGVHAGGSSCRRDCRRRGARERVCAEDQACEERNRPVARRGGGGGSRVGLRSESGRCGRRTGAEVHVWPDVHTVAASSAARTRPSSSSRWSVAAFSECGEDGNADADVS